MSPDAVARMRRWSERCPDDVVAQVALNAWEVGLEPDGCSYAPVAWMVFRQSGERLELPDCALVYPLVCDVPSKSPMTIRALVSAIEKTPVFCGHFVTVNPENMPKDALANAVAKAMRVESYRDAVDRLWRENKQ